MNTPTPQRWLALALAGVASLLVACSDDDDASAGTPITGTPASTASAVAAAETAAATPAPPSVLYVANTGGTGVAARNRCEDGARTGGVGLAEATEVQVIATPDDQCGSWTLVDAGGSTNWVRNDYLATERPAIVAAPPRGPAVPSGGVPRPVAPPTSTRVEKVLVYFEHLIPLSQLEYRSASFTQIIMTPTGPTPGAYVCPAYNYSAPTVRTTTGFILHNPDPMGCGFARADTAVIANAVVSQ